MTKQQKAIHDESVAAGPVVVFGAAITVARRLEAAGHGRITSNPGASYCGARPDPNRPYGGFYVASCWHFDQTTKSYVRR